MMKLANAHCDFSVMSPVEVEEFIHCCSLVVKIEVNILIEIKFCALKYYNTSID